MSLPAVHGYPSSVTHCTNITASGINQQEFKLCSHVTDTASCAYAAPTKPYAAATASDAAVANGQNTFTASTGPICAFAFVLLLFVWQHEATTETGSPYLCTTQAGLVSPWQAGWQEESPRAAALWLTSAAPQQGQAPDQDRPCRIHTSSPQLYTNTGL